MSSRAMMSIQKQVVKNNNGGATIADFPLKRLSEKYGIQFTEGESEIIQIINGFFWLRFRGVIDSIPAEFAGTPLELWGLIMIYSCGISTTMDYDKLSPNWFIEIRDKLVPPRWREEFEANAHWKWPLTYNIEAILLKICKPNSGMTVDSTNYLRFLDCPSPQNIMDTIHDLSSVTDRNYALFPSTHDQGVTGDEKKIIQLCYTLLQWKQLLAGDRHMIPACREGLLMEIWLINFIVHTEYLLKTNITHQPYKLILPLVYYKYFPESCKVDNNDGGMLVDDVCQHFKVENQKTIYHVYDVQKIIMKKMSKTGRNELLRHREAMWALTMARSSSRNESKIGVLSPELVQLVQQHYAYPR
jgi:hypothetical protein